MRIGSHDGNNKSHLNDWATTRWWNSLLSVPLHHWCYTVYFPYWSRPCVFNSPASKAVLHHGIALTRHDVYLPPQPSIIPSQCYRFISSSLLLFFISPHPITFDDMDHVASHFVTLVYNRPLSGNNLVTCSVLYHTSLSIFFPYDSYTLLIVYSSLSFSPSINTFVSLKPSSSVHQSEYSPFMPFTYSLHDRLSFPYPWSFLKTSDRMGCWT